MSLKGSKRTFYKQFAQQGNGDTLVAITPQEVALLTIITKLDLHENKVEEWMPREIVQTAQRGLYSITQQDLDDLPSLTEESAYEILDTAGIKDDNMPEQLYLHTLSKLYLRRAKYWKILCTQPFPTANQIAPRSLLEYGNCDDALLFSWLSWRKLIYDIDNRSAQETGYLFEPIVANCLGGDNLGSRNSVVRRLDESGNPTDRGRQVDCYVASTQTVYELKMRMTIAASGQGRFSEELSFAKEAKVAGLKPVLIVFDPTPSNRLTELSDAYKEAGGEVATGDDAWDLLRHNAEEGMSYFLDKYIKPVIEAAKLGIHSQPDEIRLSITNGELNVSNSANRILRIPRI